LSKEVLAKGKPQQNLPDNPHHKSTPTLKKRGRPPSIKKQVPLAEPLNRHPSRTRGYQNPIKPTHTNTSRISTRGSKRSLPVVTSKIETKAIPTKKVLRETRALKQNSYQDEVLNDILEMSEDSLEEVIEEPVNIEKIKEETISLRPKIINTSNGISKSRRSNGLQKEKQEKTEEGIKEICRKTVTKEFSIENFLRVEEKIKLLKQEYSRPCTYINCDLRYFNFDFLVDKLGFFDGKFCTSFSST